MKKRWVGAALLVAAAAQSGCAMTALMGYQLSPDYPDDAKTETLRLEGLSAPVQVTLDAYGVPHLVAQNEVDLARATGFMQGRQRYFQMDMMRRLARGRVSEVVGERPLVSSTTVDFDRTMRGWDIGGRADADLDKLSPGAKAALDAYTGGVNAALERYTPLEYRLLGLEPEPWRPADSMAVGLLTVWSITHNYQQEAVRLLLAMHVGVERMEAIYPAEPMAGGRTLVATAPAEPLPPNVVEELKPLFPVKALQRATAPTAALAVEEVAWGGASNAWTVSGARTKSGKPLLSNDPHLSHFLPGMLWQVHQRAPGLDVIGVTVPGVPWVLAGHNQRVAWGMTSAMTDVIDLVVEQEDPNAKGRVLHEGGPCPLTTREETFRVRDGGNVKEVKATFRSTCNGPLYNDLQPALFPEGSPLVAIRWRVTGLERSMPVLAQLDRAQSAEEFGRISADLPSTWNVWTVADVDGHIGSFPSGEVPVRPNHRGTFPVPGWLAKYEWTDWAKGVEVPHALDPEDGVLAHANNQMYEPNSPPFVRLNVDTAPHYRLDRIVQLAKATPKHDLQSFERMQVDTWSMRASEVVPPLLESLERCEASPRAKQAVALLKAWDFDARAGRPETALFFTTYRHAVAAALEDELPAPVVHFFLAQRYSTNTCDDWFKDENHVVWDDTRTPKPETRTAVVCAALERSVEELSKTLGGEVASWRWGALHQHRPMHAFGGVGALDGTVNLEAMEAGGELDSIWKSHFDLGNEKAPFKVVAGPVYRGVMDLSELTHSWWVVDTGASGWPKSPHYGDQYEKWKAGELVPMTTDLAAIQAGVHGALTLTP